MWKWVLATTYASIGAVMGWKDRASEFEKTKDLQFHMCIHKPDLTIEYRGPLESRSKVWYTVDGAIRNTLTWPFLLWDQHFHPEKDQEWEMLLEQAHQRRQKREQRLRNQ